MVYQRVSVVISGHVQGVSFRFYTVQEANRLGLAGWVQNNPDRSVKAVFEGPSSSVDQMVKWCHHGPSFARVDSVTVIKETYLGEFQMFEVR